MLKVKTFENYEAYEAYFGEKGIPYDLITIIETDNRISADVTVNCKKKKTAIRKFFEAVKDYPNLMDWDGWLNTDSNEDEHLIEECFNYMTGKNDYTGNYSVGVECLGLDNQLWYIWMNVSKEYKELTGPQYDVDYYTKKAVEYDNQTLDIKDRLVNHFEVENGGSITHEFCKFKETIKNIKIQNFARDMRTGEIYLSYKYTIYENWQEDASQHGGKECCMSLMVVNGKVDNAWSNSRFIGLAEDELNKRMVAYIKTVTPEFSYLETADENGQRS